MLAKCANPNCSNHFLYLHEGKLFRLDLEASETIADTELRKRGSRFEFYWLCDHCAADMTIVVEKGKGVTVQSFRLTERAAS